MYQSIQAVVNDLWQKKTAIDCNSGFVHAITFLEEICIYIQKIISIDWELKKILITIGQTQPSVEGESQVSIGCKLDVVLAGRNWSLTLRSFNVG